MAKVRRNELCPVEQPEGESDVVSPPRSAALGRRERHSPGSLRRSSQHSPDRSGTLRRAL